ncbi:carbohydrate binding domain-containing protein [Jiangella gansuensis]|uniref:carbohydrate binding domain-containing protein n=1 Tax=Jiangella gansuensis TaxID=281473 RepID=UPI00047C6491|nr:carbohydrate binding domain-containing protein [Jiangella gansuensis]
METVKFTRRTGLVGAAAGGLALAGVRTANAPEAVAAEVVSGEPGGEITLFGFDQVSIPFVQNLKVEMRTPTKHPANPVVPLGSSGQPDSWAAQFYGSVIKVGSTYRMWYCAVGDERDELGGRPEWWKVAYAESTDGVTWTKPNLGLVTYRGNTNNNLVAMDPGIGVLNVKVLHEPDDPDPDLGYKMAAHVYWDNRGNSHGTLAVFGSPDGLEWTSLTGITPVDYMLEESDLVLPALHAEPVGGLYKWRGNYYLSGQNANPSVRPYHGRVSRGWISGDFVSWSQTNVMSFARTAQHTLLGAGRSREGEQQHEGVSVWNRGNVLLGTYGLWHGAAGWDDVTIDLGFVISNDGVNFREPAHEFTFLERGGLAAPLPEVVNPSFEDLDGGWPVAWTLDPPPRGQTAAANTEQAHTGSLSLRVENAAGTPIAVRSDRLPAVPGSEYTASMWVQTESGTPAQLFLEFFNASGSRIHYQFVQPAASGTWQQVSVSATAPAGTQKLDVMVYGTTAAGGVSFHDDITVVNEDAVPPPADWDQGGLLQGQGFEHVGDQTFVYYGAWDPRTSDDPEPRAARGGVGIAVLPKDRFGDLVVDLRAEGSGEYQIPEVTSEFLTATVSLGARPSAPDFFVNAEGLGTNATLRLELLDDNLTPLAGYSGANAAVVSTNGFRTPVVWPGTAALPERIRIRGVFAGDDNTTIKLSAVYIV